MRVLGLTGSIGMGKSVAAALLRRLGVPVHDADAAVRVLLAGPAAPAVARLFPEAAVGGRIDRRRLAGAAFADARRLGKLEAILHPRVVAAEKAFLRRQRLRRAKLVALDIPLLYETGAERRVDRVAVVTAPAFVQRQRLGRRPGMTPGRLAAILARQMPDAAKRRRADYVVAAGLGRGYTMRRLRRIVRLERDLACAK